MIPKTGWVDIILSFFYLIIIFFIAYRIYKSKIQSNQSYKYFIIALSLKICGGLAFFAISIFYYQKGDTFLYFEIAENLRINLFENFNETFNTFLSSYSELNELDYNPLEKYDFYYERPSLWVFSKLVLIFNLLGFGSYLATTLLFSCFSFVGLWLGYISISKLYTSSYKLLLIPFFMIPTAIIWSSGILKDTVIVALVCYILFSVINVFFLKKDRVLNTLIGVLSIVLIYSLKPIFIIVFLPLSLIWILPLIIEKLNFYKKSRWFNFIIFVGIVGLGFILNYITTDVDSKYRITNLFNTLRGFQTFHSMDVFAMGQNSYTLNGVVEQPIDILYKIPASLVVTYFRPFFWEVNNFPMLLGSIESFLFIVFILYMFYTSRMYFIKALRTNSFILFLILFSLSYAIVVGLSSYNFGALSRYKILSIMFFLIAFILIKDKRKIT